MKVLLHFKNNNKLLRRYIFVCILLLACNGSVLGQTYTDGAGYIRKVIAKGSDPGTAFNTLYIDKSNNRIILMKPVSSGSPNSRLVLNDFSGFSSNLTSIPQPIAGLSNSFVPTEEGAFYKDVSASTNDKVRLISGSERTFNVGSSNTIAGFIKLDSKDYLVSRNTSTNAVTFRSVDTNNTTGNTSLTSINFVDSSTPSTLSNLASDGTRLFYRGNAAIRVFNTDGTVAGSSLLLTYNYIDDNTNYGTSNFSPTFLTSSNGCIYELATKTDNKEFKVRKISYDGSTLVFTEVGSVSISTATSGKYSSVQFSQLKFNTSNNELDASGTATHDVITLGSTGASPSTSNATDIIIYIYNNAPTTSDKTVTTDEDVELTLVTSDFSFADADGDDLHSIIITQLETNGALRLNGVDVTLNQVISKVDLDANKLKFMPNSGEFGTAYANFKFKVIDSFNSMDANNTGYSAEKTITINVNEVVSGGNPPTAANESITGFEDTNYKFSASDFNNSFSDMDGDVFASIIVTSIPSEGTLNYNGSAISVNQEVSLADFTAEKLVFIPDNHENGTSYTSFNFKVKDNSGATSTTDYTMTVNITAVNDAPSFTKGSDQSVNEDAGAQSVSNWATSLEQGGGADEDSQTLSFIVSNDNNSLFSSQPAINDSGTLTYTPAANANGSATVTVKIKDNGGTANSGVDESAEQTFTITVNAVNDAPSFTKGSDQSINEDAGAQSVSNWATSLEQGGGTDEDSQTLSFVVSNDNNSLFSSQPAIDNSGTLTYTPAANANGSATVTVKIKDNGGTANSGVDESAEQTFIITVNAINDNPVADDESVTGTEDTNYIFATNDFANDFSDVDDGQILSRVVITSLPSSGTLFFDGEEVEISDLPLEVSNANFAAFKLVFVPEPNENGSPYATLQFKVKDNGIDNNLSEEYTMTINIEPVNDAPTADNQSIELIENNSYTFTLSDFNDGFSDVDGHEFESILITSLPAVGTLYFNGIALESGDLPKEVLPSDFTSNYLVFTPLPDEYGTPYTSFSFRVKDNSDSNNESDYYLMTINVLEDPCNPITGLSVVTSTNSFTLSWDMILTATSYDVKVYLTGTPLVIYEENVTSNSLSKTGVWGGNYSWEVSANIEGCDASLTLTEGPDFSVNSCDNLIVNQSVGGINSFAVSWQPISGVSLYTVKVYRYSDAKLMKTIITRNTSISGFNLSEGDYFWVLSYEKLSSSCIALGGSFYVYPCENINYYELLTPNVVGNSATISWTYPPTIYNGRYEYYIQVTYPDGSVVGYKRNFDKLKLSNLNDGNYSWRMRAYMKNTSSYTNTIVTCVSNWKIGRNFTINSSSTTSLRESEEVFAEITDNQIDPNTEYVNFEDLEFYNDSLEGDELSLDVYPNPSSHSVNFEIGNLFETGKIEIYNLMGQLIYEKTVSSHELISNFDFSSQSKGIYIVKLSSNGNSITQKFVIE
ncbi:MAG: hypothetical protein OHK0038_06080 [Flammeovirgaceae bacterium]